MHRAEHHQGDLRHRRDFTASFTRDHRRSCLIQCPLSRQKFAPTTKFFLRGPRMPSGTRLSGPNSALYLLMPIESPKTIAAPQRNFAWGRSQRIRACQFRVAGPKTARLSWIAGRGRRLWRGDARCWLAGRPLLRQTFGAASQPVPAPPCLTRASTEFARSWSH
jgi:hypothetical protein